MHILWLIMLLLILRAGSHGPADDWTYWSSHWCEFYPLLLFATKCLWYPSISHFIILHIVYHPGSHGRANSISYSWCQFTILYSYFVTTHYRLSHRFSCCYSPPEIQHLSQLHLPVLKWVVCIAIGFHFIVISWLRWFFSHLLVSWHGFSSISYSQHLLQR